MTYAMQRCAWCGLALIGLAASALAQSVSAASVEARKKDEVISLSEFNVAATADNGYVASETMTGSRIATKIVDLPYSVVNLTSEFFEDFGVLELNDTLTFIGGLTSLDIGGQFNLRGFTSTSQLRDGFYRLGRYGQSNVDRIEVIRGPNAAIYGRASPGGMVNMISKQPKKAVAQSLTYDNGGYDTRREKFEATGTLTRDTKTYYVVTLSQFERRFDGGYSHIRNHELYGAVKHDFDGGSHLLATAEFFINFRHAPQNTVPIVTDQKGTSSSADDQVIGYAVNLPKFNSYGPNSEQNRGSSTFTLSYDKRLSDVWSFRMAGQYFRARRWDFNANTGWGSITINPASGAAPSSARGATPTKAYIMEDGGGFQGDLVAHYFLGGHAVENKTLLTVDLNDYYRWDPTWNYAASNNPDLVAWNAVRTVPLNADFTPRTLPVAYFPKWFQWGQEQLTALTRRRATSLGGNLKQQSFFLQGRVIAYAGVRYDAVRFSEFDKFGTFVGANGAVGVLRRTEHELKPNLGFNFKLNQGLRVYGSYSESYFVDQTASPATVADPNFSPETAKGWDYGFKGTYLDERLNFTVGGYYINRYNVGVTDAIETPPGSGSFVTQTRYDGNQLVRGWEADVSWRVTDDITAGASFANVNSIYTNFGSNFPEAVGRSVNGISPENGSAYAKYVVSSGALKGLSLNLMATYVSSTPGEAPNAGDTIGTVGGRRVVTQSTNQWKLRIPSFTLWNLGLRYRLPRTSRGWEQTFGLNVNNALDKSYVKTRKNLGDGRTLIFSYTLAHSGRIF
jgi:outer membrane receptor protein involved in Fe transport